MLRLADDWVWDFWTADDGEAFHIFFLKAPRSLGDPDLRHRNARVGHAVSADLVSWTELPDALVPGAPGTFDDLATWTGSVVQDDEGVWRMFTSGIARAGDGRVQRIGCSRSRDLIAWERDPLVLEPDPRWYEIAPGDAWHEEAWRDPFVFREGNRWRMLLTARAATGEPSERGVIGTAVSADLETWTVLPPLSVPGTGFGQLEVAQTYEVDGHMFLVFSCLGGELGGARAGTRGGVWAVGAPGPAGPFAIEHAYRVTDESLYVGRLIRGRDGQWVLLAFRNADSDGAFVGGIVDPVPVEIVDGRLAIGDRAHPAIPPESRRR